MEKIIKTFISQIRSVDEEKKVVEAVVSDETMDRYQEIIKADAWKKGLKSYKQHGVLLSSHNYSKLMNQIGVAEKIHVEDGKLVAKFRYFTGVGNEEADWGFFLAKQGLAAFSVGFLPKADGYEQAAWDDEDVKSGKKPSRIYNDVELLEISQVTVPANPSALQKSFEDEDYSDDVTKEYLSLVQKSLSKKDLIDKTETVVDLKKEIEIVPIFEKDMEEEMDKVLEAIENLKAYMDAKMLEMQKEFSDTLIKSLEDKKVELELKEKEITDALEAEKLQKEADELVAKQQADEDNYIKSLLLATSEILEKHLSVQS